MKFESKLGIGELALTHVKWRDGYPRQDEFVEIIGIVFSKDKPPIYCGRLPSGVLSNFDEWELISDPLFDQGAGSYPEPEEESGCELK